MQYMAVTLPNLLKDNWVWSFLNHLNLEYFSLLMKSKPIEESCTLCIIKPHIVKSKQAGKIIDAILSAGFEISAMQMIWFDAEVAQ